MKIAKQHGKTILTAQSPKGFLGCGFTHTLNPYTGCSFGNTYCGNFCYAQFLPSWNYGPRDPEDQWGDLVGVKENAADLLHKTLAKMSSKKRQELRIFMSTATDPYQPLERGYRVSQRIMETFTQFPDLGLLVIQTRSNLVERDIEIIKQIPYAWLSMTIETDQEGVMSQLGAKGTPVLNRMATVYRFVEANIPTQIAVSPALPYSQNFEAWLADSGANRFVIDTFTEGDGSRGRRTQASPLGKASLHWDWRNNEKALALRRGLEQRGLDVGWSAEGFGGIPSYYKDLLSAE